MNSRFLRTFTAVGVLSGLLAAPTLAQESTDTRTVAQAQAARQPVLNERIGNITVNVTQGVAVNTLRPNRQQITLTAPDSAEIVYAERNQDDYDVAIGMRIGAEPYDLFDYYRRLMAAQGFQLISLDANVEGQGGLFGGGFGGDEENYDAQHINATFARLNNQTTPVTYEAGIYNTRGIGEGAGQRVEFLLDRESAYGYVVYMSPEEYGGTYGVYERPLFYGGVADEPYGFYGPVGYEGYEALPRGARSRINVVAPRNAELIAFNRVNQNAFRYRLRSQAGAQDIANQYDRVLTQQGFQRQSGQVGQTGGEVTYVRGDREVILDVDRVRDNVFDAVIRIGAVQ